MSKKFDLSKVNKEKIKNKQYSNNSKKKYMKDNFIKRKLPRNKISKKELLRRKTRKKKWLKLKAFRYRFRLKLKAKKKSDYLLFRRIRYKWKPFFVIRKWRPRAVRGIKKMFKSKLWFGFTKHKYRRRIILSSRRDREFISEVCFAHQLNRSLKILKDVFQLSFFSLCRGVPVIGKKFYSLYWRKKNLFRVSLKAKRPKYKSFFKYSCVLNSYNYWKVVKKKKNKHFKIWYNFFFFFTRFFKPKAATLRCYLGYVNENKFFLRNNPHVIAWKKNRFSIMKRANNMLVKRAHKKGLIQAKKTYWRKLMLKKFFMGNYLIVRQYQLRNLIFCSRRLYGSKILNFYFYLESRVIPTCFRMCFFWNKRRGVNWVNWGFVYVNSYLAASPSIKVGYNSLIRIIVPKEMWSICSSFFGKSQWGALKFKRLALNSYELGINCFIGVVLNIPRTFKDVVAFFFKRKKYWINLQTFSYLLNSFF